VIQRPQSLDPQLLASIGDLELVARVTVEGTVTGLHRSPFHGYSAEFSQYRHYRAGDDLKYVDWKLFARTDRVYTKQFRETTDLGAQVALDASASMGYAGAAGPSKFAYARILAAAMAYLIVGQGDGAGLVAFDDDVRHYVGVRSGQAHLRNLLVALSKIEARGRTAAATAVRRAADLLERRGLLILISDLYDEDDGVERELERAVTMGHEVAVFHVVTREEVEFPFHGDLEVEDLESGRTVLTNASAVAGAYQQRFAAFLDGWQSRCAARRIEYVRAITDVPPDAALRKYLLTRARGRP
jgi:uncharacterized protein (DUF58 family)